MKGTVEPADKGPPDSGLKATTRTMEVLQRLLTKTPVVPSFLHADEDDLLQEVTSHGRRRRAGTFSEERLPTTRGRHRILYRYL